MFDDDFSWATGRQADLDLDGKVSFEEYLNDLDDFNRIYGNKRYSSGRYKPPQKSSGKPIKMGAVGWILSLLLCIVPLINTFINLNDDEMIFGVIISLIVLAIWVFAFCNREK